jgi:hypothetical protein
VARSRVLVVEWRWWLSGGQTSGSGGRITTSLSVVLTYRCHHCSSRAAPSPAAVPSPAAPLLVSTSIYLAVWTCHRLCLSCRRASSCRSIVISVIVDVVVVGLDINVIGGFNALANRLTRRRASSHRSVAVVIIVISVVIIIVVIVFFIIVILLVVVVIVVIVLVMVVVIHLHRCCCCPNIITVVVVVIIAFG